MPKEMMTSAPMGVTQMEDRMYKVVVGASHPERVLKDEVMRIKGEVSPKQLESMLGRVYVKLGSNEHTAPVAGYMKDLYGLDTTHRLFDPQKHTPQIDVAKLLRESVGKQRRGRIPSFGRSKVSIIKSAAEGKIAVPVFRSAKATGAARVETRIFEEKTTARESSDTSSPAASASNPHGWLNLKATVEYCLRTKYYDELKPIYDLLLELSFGVNNQEWFQAKKTIQAHLEKLAPRGSHNTIHNGDVVNEKNVNHVETVEANGVGFAEKVATATPKSDDRKRAAQSSKIVTDVYKYAYYDNEGGTVRITQLYQALKKAHWIDQDTEPDVFLQLFSGEPGSFYIKWTGAQSDLYALIKKLHDEHLVTCPPGATLWVIAQNHFKNKASKSFTNWNKQKEKKRSQKAIDYLVDLLVPKTAPL